MLETSARTFITIDLHFRNGGISGQYHREGDGQGISKAYSFLPEF